MTLRVRVALQCCHEVEVESSAGHGHGVQTGRWAYTVPGMVRPDWDECSHARSMWQPGQTMASPVCGGPFFAPLYSVACMFSGYMSKYVVKVEESGLSALGSALG